MVRHKSAIKRARQSEQRRKRNQHVRSGMRTVVKQFRQAIEAGDAAAARERFTDAERSVRRAASKGVIPRQRADRTVSRLAQALNRIASR